jgi:hypothetical protein
MPHIDEMLKTQQQSRTIPSQDPTTTRTRVSARSIHRTSHKHSRSPHSRRIIYPAWNPDSRWPR